MCAAEGRDRTERALVVAALADLEVGAPGPPHPCPRFHVRPAVMGWSHVEHLFALAKSLLNDVREPAHLADADIGVRARSELHEFRAEALGETTRHDHPAGLPVLLRLN